MNQCWRSGPSFHRLLLKKTWLPAPWSRFYKYLFPALASSIKKARAQALQFTDMNILWSILDFGPSESTLIIINE